MWRAQNCWSAVLGTPTKIACEPAEPWLHESGRRDWTCLWYPLSWNDVRFGRGQLFLCVDFWSG